MADTFKLTMIKTFDYRGKPEEWSNSYHFENEPADATAFNTAVDAMAAKEKFVLNTDTNIVRAYGYDFGATTATYVRDLSGTPVAGVFTPISSTAEKLPGDCAATVRWGTDTFTSRGKRIYLRKYFHGIYSAAATTPDLLDNDLLSALDTFGEDMEDPDPIGLGLYVSPSGEPTIGHKVSQDTTIRQLKRRGRRPLTGP